MTAFDTDTIAESPSAQRSHELLINYWLMLKGERDYPMEAELEPEVLHEIWPHCFLVNVKPGGLFQYAFLGDALVEAYGSDVTGQAVSDRLIDPHHAAMAKKFAETVESGAPVVDENEFVNEHGQTIKYRNCLLPLGYKGNVDFIIGAMRWKAF